MKYSSAESEYLVKLIKWAINSEPVEPAPDGLDWNGLVELSKSQQVYSIIATVQDAVLLPENQGQEMKLYNQNELLRLIAMKSELEAIEKDLENHGIRFMLLKGSVLRELYPQQKMRQMSDIDILYDYSKRNELIKLMKSRGFRLVTTCENSDDFFKEPFYTFEFHRELFFEEAEFYPRFDLWKNAMPVSEYKYCVNPEEHFVYTLCHMYKHYSTNGCGIRFLCDIYVQLKNGVDLDFAFKRLEEIGILRFSQDAVSLAKAIFCGGDVNENQQDMLDFLLSNGVYGCHIIDYSKELDAFGGSKLKYLWSRLFPPKKKMVREYKILEKKPWLLPACYIIRLFTKTKYNSSSAIKELKEIKKVKK